MSIEVFKSVSNLQELNEYHLRNTATKEMIELLEHAATKVKQEKQASEVKISDLYEMKKTQLKNFFYENQRHYTQLFDDLLEELENMKEEMRITKRDPNAHLSEIAKRMVYTIVHLQERSKELVPIREEINNRAFIYCLETPPLASASLNRIFPDIPGCKCINCARIQTGLSAGRAHSFYDGSQENLHGKQDEEQQNPQKEPASALDEPTPCKKPCIESHIKKEELQGIIDLDSESPEGAGSAQDTVVSSTLIPFVLNNQLFTTNGRTKAVSKRCEFPLRLDSGSRSVLLPDEAVFTCGSNNRNAGFCAFVVDSRGNVDQQANMRSQRSAHGLILYPGTGIVYTFGGEEPLAAQSSECFSVSTRIWETLPKMNYGRSHFNPCIFHDQIYLCGGSTFYSVELFSLQSKRFTLASIRLPATMDVCYAVSSSKEIIVIGNRKAAQLTIEADGKLRVREISSKNYSKKLPIANPVRRGYEVSVVTRGLIARFDLGHLKFETIKSFGKSDGLNSIEP